MTINDPLLEQWVENWANQKGAAYFPEKYYFSVRTGRARAYFGLLPGQPITATIQQIIRQENLVPLFHEYIHYVHEISTLVGNFSTGLSLIKKTLFSQFMDPRPESCEGTGITGEGKELYRAMTSSLTLINGSTERNCKISNIRLANSKYFPLWVYENGSIITDNFEIPLLYAEITRAGKKVTDEELSFGKFYIYEGLAYELDRELNRQLKNRLSIDDEARDTEYTVLRSVAKNIWPDVTRKTFLTIASLSLTYVDSGRMFIQELQNCKARFESGESIYKALEPLRKQTKELLGINKSAFRDQMAEIIKVFEGRPRLLKAFSYICDQANKAYEIRTKKPSFEVDLIFAVKYNKLLDMVPVCDYMYEFTDKDAFNRDMIGTASMDDDTSQACKVLIAYSHYHECHKEYSTTALEAMMVKKGIGAPCPFYSVCNLNLRADHTEICGATPWRIYEISAKTDKRYCWYGNAVMEYKGHTT